MSKASLKDFVDYARPRPGRFLFYGVCLECVAWLALLDVIINLTDFSNRGFPVRLPGIFTPAYYLMLFVALRRISKRCRLNSKKILLTDERAPVLYLRAFYEESAPQVLYYDKDRTDETLAKVLKNVGPLVAVGKPGERQPPLGAVRVYFAEDVWQENVKTLMGMSRLVVIQAGHSPSLGWEIATAVKCLKPQQLLFTFNSWQELDEASRQSKFAEFARHLKLVSNFDLPEQIGRAHFLYFDHEWNPHLASLSSWKRALFSVPASVLEFFLGFNRQSTFHELPRSIKIRGIFRQTSVTCVREALRPVMRTQGIRLPVLKTVLNFSLSLGIILLLSIYFLLLIFLILVFDLRI